MTMDDMLEFYRTFFDPKSATRSKVAIHMIAQASAEAIAEKTDPAEQRRKLAEALAGVLSQLSLQADVSALTERLEKIDIASGDTAGIVSAVGTYLKEDPGNKPEQVDGAMEQAPAVLAQILPQLGIKAKKGEGEVEGGKAPEKRNKTVFIEDVKAWKASLPLSAGPKAARELSEFEELESKL